MTPEERAEKAIYDVPMDIPESLLEELTEKLGPRIAQAIREAVADRDAQIKTFVESYYGEHRTREVYWACSAIDEFIRGITNDS